MASQTVKLPKEKYEGMKEEISRMQETIEVLSDKPLVRKLEAALERFGKGEFLTEDEVLG